MTVQTVTLDLPQDIYARLQQMARATQQSLEDVVVYTIRGNLPPVMNDLPPELQGELVSLQNQSDRALLTLAQESVPSEQWRRHEYLLSRNQDGSLTAAERAELTRLRTTVDRLVLRRSYALALLKWRGYTISESLMFDASPA